MARPISTAAAAVLAVASAASDIAINPEAALEAIAGCLIAVLDSLLTRRRVPEISEKPRRTFRTILNAIRRGDTHA